MTLLLETVEQELRRLAADETTKGHLGQNDATVAKGKGDKGSGKGLTDAKKLVERKNTLSPFMSKPDGCSFGDRCHYRHDKAEPKAKPKPKPKAEPKRKCIFWSRKSGCKLGDKCKYLHEGPSGAAKADVDQTAQSLPGLVGSESQAAKAKAKSKAKAQAKASAVTSYVNMISSGPRRSNPFPYGKLPNWDLWICRLTDEQYRLWIEHPHAMTGFFGRLHERQHREVDAWFILREALIEGKYTTEYTHLHGNEWIMNSYTVSAWNKNSGEHEPAFLLNIFDTTLGSEKFMVITQSRERPGTDRPFNDMQLEMWLDEGSEMKPCEEETLDTFLELDEYSRDVLSPVSSLLDIGASSHSAGFSESESEQGSVEGEAQEDPLWCVVLNMREYLNWGRPGQLNTEAERQFRIVLDQNSIAVGLWYMFQDAEFDFPLNNVHLNETQSLVEAKHVLVQYDDGAFRDVVLCWVTDVEHAREQFMAITRSSIAPVVQRPPFIQQDDPGPESRETAGARRGHSVADICMNGKSCCDQGILLDTGANEILRQSSKKPSRSIPLPLTLANGSSINAHRSRDGEVVIIGENGGDIICGVNRLIQVGCVFNWDVDGPRVQLPEDLGGTWVCLKEINGLPYMDRDTFMRLRPCVTKYWKSSHRCNNAFSEATSGEVSNPSVSLEVMMSLAATEDADSGGDINTHGEALAADLLSKGDKGLTYDDVLRTIRGSRLQPFRSKAWKSHDDPESRVPQLIRACTFGAYSYSSCRGVTAGSKTRPCLLKLLNRFLKVLEPNASWTSLILNDGITYQPHRDHQNQKGSLNLIVCLDDEHAGQGGGLWIENDSGEDARQISPNNIRKGTVHDIRRQPLRFDPGLWHGTESWRGSRLSITAFTAGRWEQLSDEDKRQLRELEFPLPGSDSGANSTNHSTIAPVESSSTHPCPEVQGGAQAVSVEQDVRDGECRLRLKAALDPAAMETVPADQAVAFLGEAETPSDAGIFDSEFEHTAYLESLRQMEQRCKQGLYDKTCPECKLSRGALRPHRHLDPSNTSKAVLSIDLTGPHAVSIEGFKYALIGVYTLNSGESLQYAMGLKRKTAEEAACATLQILARLHSLGAPPLVRIHSDNGGEFTGKKFQDMTSKLGVWQTFSAPYHRQANGRAERAVQACKVACEVLVLGHARAHVQAASSCAVGQDPGGCPNHG